MQYISKALIYVYSVFTNISYSYLHFIGIIMFDQKQELILKIVNISWPKSNVKIKGSWRSWRYCHPYSETLSLLYSIYTIICSNLSIICTILYLFWEKSLLYRVCCLFDLQLNTSFGSLSQLILMTHCSH